MKIWLVAFTLSLVAVPVVISGCKNALSADEVAIDLTNAVCVPLEAQPAGQPWVDFACTIASTSETVIATLEQGDAGTSLPAVHKVLVRVPVNEAPTFMSTHRGQ